jgi:hypothetical protein
MTMTHKLAAALLALGLATPVLAQKASDAKTASEYFLAYHKAKATAKTIEDLRPFLPVEQQKEMDKASKEEQARGVEVISGAYSDLINLKVVKETPTANGYTLNATGTRASENIEGTATVEISKDEAGWHVDSEVWTFPDITITLQKKKP